MISAVIIPYIYIIEAADIYVGVVGCVQVKW